MGFRPNATSRGYDSRWGKARVTFLKEHPFCVMCAKRGERVYAVVVDHIKPHRGDRGLFWDKNNWQPLCGLHHRASKSREENRGYSGEIGLDGWPVDPRHPANKGHL